MPTQNGSSSISGAGTVVASGLVFERTPYGLLRVTRYVGEQNVPAEVKRRRRSVHDLMRRMGTPVLLKHRFTPEDERAGIAVTSSNWDSVYSQTRAFDPFSHGTGLCSAELSDDEWITPDGSKIVTGTTSPGPGYEKAPKYRGYGPGYLTYVVLPDVPFDNFRLTPAGLLQHVQNARGVASWYPDMNDNDLMIMLELDSGGEIAATRERFELKQQQPVTMHGNDRRGRGEQGTVGGNHHKVNQTFGMVLVPDNNPIYDVETDR